MTIRRCASGCASSWRKRQKFDPFYELADRSDLIQRFRETSNKVALQTLPPGRTESSRISLRTSDYLARSPQASEADGLRATLLRKISRPVPRQVALVSVVQSPEFQRVR